MSSLGRIDESWWESRPPVFRKEYHLSGNLPSGRQKAIPTPKGEKPAMPGETKTWGADQLSSELSR
jgi:hypothetical protein